MPTKARMARAKMAVEEEIESLLEHGIDSWCDLKRLRVLLDTHHLIAELHKELATDEASAAKQA